MDEDATFGLGAVESHGLMTTEHRARLSQPIVGAARFVSRWADPLATALGGLLLAIASILDDHGVLPTLLVRVALLVVGAMLTGAAAVDSKRAIDRATKLEQELQSSTARVAAVRKAVDSELERLGEALGYLSDERVTVFLRVDDGFVAVGRHSANPSLCRTGRDVYPDGEGCIGKAWEGGAAHVYDLPDPIGQPDAWQNAMAKDWKVDRDVSARMLMKPRAVVAIRLGGEGGPIGVVAFESRRAQPVIAGKPSFTEGALKLVLQDDQGKRLVSLLQMSQTFLG
jgi:hypothetical protein